MAQVEGSGTTEPDSENAALNGPWPVMSVPMRSQSGSMPRRCHRGSSSAGRQRKARCRHDRFRRRQPKEVAVVQLDLGHEEIMIGREEEGRGEGHVELHLLARDRTVAAGVYGLVWDGFRRASRS